MYENFTKSKHEVRWDDSVDHIPAPSFVQTGSTVSEKQDPALLLYWINCVKVWELHFNVCTMSAQILQ